MRVPVGGLKFDFEDGWDVEQFDDLPFYRRHFIGVADGIKAIDLLALDADGETLWLIEVKDFRRHRRVDDEPIEDVIVGKVLGTLAALLPARNYESDARAALLAEEALKRTRIRVVFHVEQPRVSSRLFPRVIDRSKLQQVLRRRLKPIDPHPLVVESSVQSMSWRVS